ncbi:MAG: primase C-terminal domain-containing protein [Terriglobia bacterium]
MRRPTSTEVAAFRSLFVARPDAYVLWRAGNPVAVHRPLDKQVLEGHLAGDGRVGTYLLLRGNLTPFLVFDLDEPNKSLVLKIRKRLKRHRIPAYVERSKSKGFHIWVFFEKPLHAKLARRFASALIADLGNTKIEIFPKQDCVPKEGLGNCIWLPLHSPDVVRRRTVFLDSNFHSIPDQWGFLAEVRRVGERRVRRALETMALEAPANSSPASNQIQRFPRTKQFPRLRNHAPKLAPCAQAILLQGADEGNRNVALFTLAKHLRGASLDQAAAGELVRAANMNCRPPLSEQEVRGIIQSVFAKGYTSLGCDKPFIASLCSDQCPVKRANEKRVGTSAIRILDQAEARPRIHPSQAYVDGKLWYGLNAGREEVWVNSDRQANSMEEMLDRFTLERKPTKMRWSTAGVKRFLRESGSVSPAELFLKIRGLLEDHIRFRSRWQPTLVALWTMGTYVHQAFAYYGYLWLTSPGRRSGKSLLLEIISCLAYNATPVMTDPSEASLYRDTAANSSTQVLDEVESLRRADQEKHSGLMAMLNCGFKAGAKVPRFDISTNRVEDLDAYCPRALAGISRLHPVLADRCFKIFLKRKRPDDKVKRFSERRLASKLQGMRDDLHVFGLLYAPPVGERYDESDSLVLPPEVDDRARDILEPLFAIAWVVDNAGPELAIAEVLTVAARAIARDRASDEGEDEEITAALEILVQDYPEGKDKWILRSDRAVGIFKSHESLEWMEYPRQAANLLRRLGFRSAPHRIGRKVTRGYQIRRHVLIDMCKCYGVNLANSQNEALPALQAR